MPAMWTGYEIDPELALWRNAFLIAQLGALIAQPSGPFSTALSPLRSYFYRGRNAWPIRHGPTASGTLKYPPSVVRLLLLARQSDICAPHPRHAWRARSS